MKTFLLFDFIAQKTYKYFIEELNIDVSTIVISKVYEEMRQIISNYINIEYQSNLLGELNSRKYYSVDECNIITINGTQIWLLGIIDNENKDFRIEPILSRNTVALKNFINKYVSSGNYIVTDGWRGYDFLDKPDSGYRRFKHNHGSGDFGYGQQSTSHIESIWAQIRAKIKEIYHSMPHKNFLEFVREIEFKIKVSKLNAAEKIGCFFDAYKTTLGLSDNDYENVDNLFMKEFSSKFAEEYENDSEDA